jgi:sterol desaturase/sphingolipid hydroxylase (fatty acid hydroxylase superfamily)
VLEVVVEAAGLDAPLPGLTVLVPPLEWLLPQPAITTSPRAATTATRVDLRRTADITTSMSWFTRCHEAHRPAVHLNRSVTAAVIRSERTDQGGVTATQQALINPPLSATGWRVAWLRSVYLPTVGVAILAAWLCREGWLALAPFAPLHQIRSAEFQLAGPVVLGFVLIVFAIERVWPAQPRPALARGHRVDAMYFGVHALLGVPIMVLAGTGFSSLLARHAPWMVLPTVPAVPRIAFVALAVIGIDAFDWIAHYGSHRLTALWRLHAVHHSQEELSILSTFRTSPLVHIGFIVTAIPVLTLARNNATPAELLTAFACFGALPHANVRWSYGRLGRSVISPMYHRVHHRTSGRLDINLGTLFTWWDRLAHRAVFPDLAAPIAATGLGGRPIQVEQASDKPRYFRLVGHQLIQPFLATNEREIT